MSPEARADADARNLLTEVEFLRARLARAEATIRAMGGAAGDCRRAYDAWVQDEWRRGHAPRMES